MTSPVASAQQRTLKLRNYVEGRWYEASGGFVELRSAVDGRIVAQLSSRGLDFGAMVRHARERGGRALRELTFAQRAALLKALAAYIDARKAPLYELSYDTGATKRDQYFDVDGGIGTSFRTRRKGAASYPTSVSCSKVPKSRSPSAAASSAGIS